MSRKLTFPKGFYWGAASASYQVEGGIENTDWAYEARTSKRVPLADSGPDHFNRFEEDFDIAKSLGHNAHRFSIEWARIEPAEGEFSQDGIRHYQHVLKALQKRGLTPFVTLWHFTLPKWLYEKGGAEHKDFPEYFARYCAFVTKHLGEDCSHWVTMNEPNVFASNGWFRGNWPPFKKGHILRQFRVLRNLAKAHNRAYTRMKEHDLVAEIGIVKDNIYFHANWNPFNKFAAWFMRQYWNFSFLNKVYKNTDSIGLNYYFHKKFGDTAHYKKNDMGWDLYPEGIYHTLMELKRYKKPVFVAEAGTADAQDHFRGKYIKDLVYWMHRAIDDGVPLKGYMYWSLTDNFEWALGYTKRFGLIAINYQTKERRVRESAYVLREIALANAVTVDE